MVGERWLAKLNESFNQSGATLITGPVKISPCDRMLSAFEAMDVAITMVVTAFGIQRKLYYLANGANLAFAKKVYEATGGYQNHIHHASGDDVFLCRSGPTRQQDRLCRRCRSHCYHQTTTGMETAAAATEAVGHQNAGVCRVKYLDGSRHGRVGKHQPAYDVNSWFFNPSAWFGGAVILISKGVIDFIALWLATIGKTTEEP